MMRSMHWALGVTIVAAAACAPPAATGNGGAAAAPTGGTPTATAPAAPPAAGGAVSVYTGVYTAEQAARGMQVQQRECANCHSSADWAQGRLLTGWTGQTVYHLLDNIRTTMPMDGPGRLSMQQYTDIVAYMLQVNEIPAGQAELPANDDALRQITIEYRR